jgi:uncharacterized membrane protein YfcA
MLEVIALYFLCKKIGVIAIQKGLTPRTWKWYTVLAWILTEMIGVLLGIIFYGENNLEPVMLLGLISAFGGYLIIKFILEKKPDLKKDEIDQIRVDELQPPIN